jgi:hypothetical protein
MPVYASINSRQVGYSIQTGNNAGFLEALFQFIWCPCSKSETTILQRKFLKTCKLVSVLFRINTVVPATRFGCDTHIRYCYSKCFLNVCRIPG